jgi:hypothetical protein
MRLVVGKDASQDDIEDSRNATADLIEGGKIFVKVRKKEFQARLSLHGLGAFVLRVAKVSATARNGSGGRI